MWPISTSGLELCSRSAELGQDHGTQTWPTQLTALAQQESQSEKNHPVPWSLDFAMGLIYPLEQLCFQGANI